MVATSCISATKPLAVAFPSESTASATLAAMSLKSSRRMEGGGGEGCGFRRCFSASTGQMAMW